MFASPSLRGTVRFASLSDSTVVRSSKLAESACSRKTQDALNSSASAACCPSDRMFAASLACFSFARRASIFALVPRLSAVTESSKDLA